MKLTKLIMGMPVTVQIEGARAGEKIFDRIFSYFRYVDEKFSTYKEYSEISKINRGEIPPNKFSRDMRTVFELSEQTKRQSGGFFDIKTARKTYDPSGLVKGWAIYRAALIVKSKGFTRFLIEAGGDIQAGMDEKTGRPWQVGIRNPFDRRQVVKILRIKNEGVATSGTYIRGQHVYNPFDYNKAMTEILSITVVGPNVYEADRFATAAFAMGKDGIGFIESMPGLEGYMINKDGIATMTSGFAKYT